MSNGRALGVRQPAPPSAHAPPLPLEEPGCARSIIDAFVLLLSERKAWKGGLTFRRHLELNRHFSKMRKNKRCDPFNRKLNVLNDWPPRRTRSVLLKCRDIYREGMEIKRNPFRGKITYYQKIVLHSLFCISRVLIGTRTQQQGPEQQKR